MWHWCFYNAVLWWCTIEGRVWFPTASLLWIKLYHTVHHTLSHCSRTNLYKLCVQVTKGLYTFLLHLFVLRCFQSSDGMIWRCNDSHIYLVEYTKRKHRECDRHSSEVINVIFMAYLHFCTTDLEPAGVLTGFCFLWIFFHLFKVYMQTHWILLYLRTFHW